MSWRERFRARWPVQQQIERAGYAAYSAGWQILRSGFPEYLYDGARQRGGNKGRVTCASGNSTHKDEARAAIAGGRKFERGETVQGAQARVRK
jgi:hypothetical protein